MANSKVCHHNAGRGFLIFIIGSLSIRFFQLVTFSAPCIRGLVRCATWLIPPNWIPYHISSHNSANISSTSRARVEVWTAVVCSTLVCISIEMATPKLASCPFCVNICHFLERGKPSRTICLSQDVSVLKHCLTCHKLTALQLKQGVSAQCKNLE